MPQDADNNSTSGATPSEAPRPTLREVAEAAWDEGSSDDYSTDDGDDGSTPDRGDGRDARGRFVPKEQAQKTGEAEEEPPSPDEYDEAQDRPDPAPQGTSNQPPEHWSAEDKANFARLPQESRDFFMRRYSEMEADYTRKSQANAAAVQAIQSLAPIFQDPDIYKSVIDANLTPMQAIYDWARLHKSAISSDPRTRAGVLYEIAERMGFDPAKVFATSRPPVQISPELEKEPAVRYFADLQSKTNSDLQALRAELQSFKAQESSRLEQEAFRVTRSSIDAFADEVGQDGRPLRPYFDHVINRIIVALKADPSRDLNTVYDEACWAEPEIRKLLIQAERQRVQQQQSNDRARMAVRGNVRGLTSPVAKAAPDRKSNGSLRDMLEASADEVGF